MVYFKTNKIKATRMSGFLIELKLIIQIQVLA